GILARLQIASSEVVDEHANDRTVLETRFVVILQQAAFERRKQVPPLWRDGDRLDPFITPQTSFAAAGDIRGGQWQRADVTPVTRGLVDAGDGPIRPRGIAFRRHEQATVGRRREPFRVERSPRGRGPKQRDGGEPQRDGWSEPDVEGQQARAVAVVGNREQLTAPRIVPGARNASQVRVLTRNRR